MLPILLMGILLGRVESGTPERFLEVRAEECRDGVRKIIVVLAGRDAPCGVGATMPEHWDRTPCDLSRKDDHWTARIPDQVEVSVTVRDAPLGKARHGVLLSLEGGREHVHRWHG